MKIQDYNKCNECKGTGELSVMESVYPGTPDSHIMAPIGSEKCLDCNGTGIEPNEQIILERIFDNRSEEDEKKLQEYLVNEVREIGGRGINKDNCEDMFENWLSSLDLEEVVNILTENG